MASALPTCNANNFDRQIPLLRGRPQENTQSVLYNAAAYISKRTFIFASWDDAFEFDTGGWSFGGILARDNTRAFEFWKFDIQCITAGLRRRRYLNAGLNQLFINGAHVQFTIAWRLTNATEAHRLTLPMPAIQ